MSIVFLLYALAHIALFGWTLRLFLQHRYPATVPLLIVLFGLVYDNAVLAGGAWIGHGELLERLSVPRFFMHAFGTPLLMLSAIGLTALGGDLGPERLDCWRRGCADSGDDRRGRGG